jgi:hypothetical protein
MLALSYRRKHLGKVVGINSSQKFLFSVIVVLKSSLFLFLIPVSVGR